jgi:PKD repeat protein
LKKKYTILLIAAVMLAIASCRRNLTVPVVKADFTYEVVDSNYSIPVQIVFTNTSSFATNYKWTFENGSPATYDQQHPGGVIFNTPGTVKIKLESWSTDGRDAKEITIVIDSVVKAAFDATPVINNYGPTQFTITNRSYGGATKFTWSFPTGSPSTSTDKNPSVNFSTAGPHVIKLLAENNRGRKDTISKTVMVLPPLSAASFTIDPSFDDDDYEAPLTATLNNRTTSVTTHRWVAPGGVLSSTTDSVPTVTYNSPGTYTVTYYAGNGKQSDSTQQTIIVRPNTGLRTFTNVKLGINTAHSTIGSFFSTRLRRVFKQGEVTSSNGPLIDIVYYGLSSSFSFNLFSRPDSVQLWAFSSIVGATYTKLVNKQESCGCGTPFTETAFNNTINGSTLAALTVTETYNGLLAFNNSVVPRIVLFQNAAGKKGAIKIKQYVVDGQQSYILCDIKVQKD